MSDIKIYDFMKYRKYALIFSLVMLVISIWSLATKGLVLGLDFSGGTQIEVGYETPADVSEIRNNLESVGFSNPIVVHFGAETDVLIRLQGEPDQELASKILDVLKFYDDNHVLDLLVQLKHHHLCNKYQYKSFLLEKYHL